jgi:hypothetical protein
MRPQLSTGVLQERVETIGKKAEDDHKRLRTDVDGIGKKVAGIEIVQADVLLRLKTLELAPPPNVEKVSWTTRQSVGVATAIAGAVLAISAWMYSIQGGIKDVHTDVNAAAAAVTAATKLQDERNDTQNKQIAEIKSELRLTQIEVQNLGKQLSDYMLQKNKP